MAWVGSDTRTFHYPSGAVEVSRDEFDGPVCPGCGGDKSRSSGRCWRCAGQPMPRSRGTGPLRARVLTVLDWNWPDERPHGSIRESDLLQWASTLTDDELLGFRNMGRKGLAWIRAAHDGGITLTGSGHYEDIPTPIPELVHRMFGPQMSVTIGPKRGVQIAFRLLWESCVAAFHRTTVTFTTGQTYGISAQDATDRLKRVLEADHPAPPTARR